MLDRQLCIEVVKQLEYVSNQALGSRLKKSIKDDEMVQVWLMAGELRQIDLLLKEIDRIARDKAAIKARKERNHDGNHNRI